tara:strand:- start:1071 stop:1655 length:585 start_codon:yes stop_codon:yes gene_type:complete
MKNLSQIITILLSVLFFGYIFYTYEPIEKTKKTIEKKNEGHGLIGFGFEDIEEYEHLEISNQGELDLIINLINEYNKMNIDSLTSFFADSCDFSDLNGNIHILTQEDFEIGFNKMDSVRWEPLAIVPLKLVDDENFWGGKSRTGTLVHSLEKRYKKDGSVWKKELLEVFYIKDNEIIDVNQFGKESNLGDGWTR